MAENKIAIAKKMNVAIASVIEQNIDGFEKAFVVSSAIGELRTLLNKEYMAPFMDLQGQKLGFKTDKVYPEPVVKDCLIEAVLTGVQPTGNHFNIIAGNCYITKEGFGYLLKMVPGLKYTITFGIPEIKSQGAIIEAIIRWSVNGGEENNETLTIPIKVNKYMGSDAIIGKATRKARAWLYNTVTNNEISDGDVDTNDAKAVVVDVDHQEVKADPELDRFKEMLDANGDSEAKLKMLEPHADTPEKKGLLTEKINSLK